MFICFFMVVQFDGFDGENKSFNYYVNNDLYIGFGWGRRVIRVMVCSFVVVCLQDNIFVCNVFYVDVFIFYV